MTPRPITGLLAAWLVAAGMTAVATVVATVVVAVMVAGMATGMAHAQPASSMEARAALEKELAETQALDRLQAYWRLSMREPGDALAPMRKELRTVDPVGAWRKAVDQVFAARNIAGAVAKSQAAGLNDGDARAVIAFRRTELGRKVTEAEVTSPFPVEKLGDQAFVMGEINKAGRALEKDKARKKVITDILQAAGGGAMQAELALTLSRGFAVGLTLSQPAPRPSIDEVIALVDKDRATLIALMGKIAVPSLALAYRELSQAELQAYLKHLQSPVGRKNIATLTKAFATVLSETSREIGRTFAKNISAQRT